jgi:hypothetical protein
MTPNVELGAALENRSDLPAHWFGLGVAPNFGRQVARASAALHAAEEALFQALKQDYPLGKRVAVIHYRGHFYGYVVGWDHVGARVAVKNEDSLKTSKWWAAHVQLCPY